MDPKMILSASGWRKVFSISGEEQDKSIEISCENRTISIAAGIVFYEYLCSKTGIDCPVIAVGIDTRPTGPAIADGVIRALLKKGAIIQYSGITSAPEIMAYAKKLDGFVYISASHNPIGHNGIKFGTNDGGVLNGQENALLVKRFLEILSDDSLATKITEEAMSISSQKLDAVYTGIESAKFNALHAYEDFICETVVDTKDIGKQKAFFDNLQNSLSANPAGIVCDFNGSSRARCIDKEFFTKNKINFYSINDNQIVHEIIPEAENLVHVAAEMEKLHAEGHTEVMLGYMPDCDGDRGNIVYWDENTQKAVILKAQEVFSLSVLAELTYSIWNNKSAENFKPAVAVNCPTSMRIEEIAGKLGAQVFRAEVGEANVVNLAREKRAEGYTVRILGEGSNGGTITYPAAVRDPINTVFAIIKLLKMADGALFKIWCEKTGIPFKADFTLTDVLSTLPVYTTTGVSEARALLKINTKDHSQLKARFQKIFEADWKNKVSELKKKYNISDYEAVITKGTKETRNVSDFSESGKGGLKIILKSEGNPVAFMWMRGSGTEPVFRIMCDVKGNNPDFELFLCKWLTELLQVADK